MLCEGMGDRASGAELQDTALAPPQLQWLLGKVLQHFGSAMAPFWAQSLCSVGVHFSWHFTYRNNGCRPPKLPLSSGSSETKADMICQDSTSPMLLTASCSCQDALHCTYPGDTACPICHLPPPFQGVHYLLATASSEPSFSPETALFPPSPPSFLLGATLLLKVGFSMSTGPEYSSPSWCSGVGTTLLNS